jgi:hypothetical protein
LDEVAPSELYPKILGEKINSDIAGPNTDECKVNLGGMSYMGAKCGARGAVFDA